MRIFFLCAVFAAAIAPACQTAVPEALPQGKPEPITVGPADWPWWRGPNRDGIAAAGQTPPLKWSETENVLWKSPVPGRGHGSATVVGDQVFLATADHDQETQAVLCYDRQTGKQVWRTVCHTGGFEKKGNGKASLASASVACDGKLLFVNFLNGGAVHATALDREGKILWQKKVTDFLVHQGFGSSPAVYGSLVLVSADSKSKGLVVGLDRATGNLVWKRERPQVPNYTSPIILKVGGREQLVMTGCELVTGLDPLTGKELWEVKGSTTECVTSVVTDGKLLFTSGGYPKNHVSAFKGDGSGELVWENGSRVYVPSMLVHEGHLHAVLDAGFAVCWKSDTGKEVWRGRLGGTFSASPVLVGDLFFATNEAGTTFIYKASNTAFELVGENQLGTEVMATPTFCGNRIYMRVATKDKDKRQEMLYCLGKAD